MKKKPCVFEMQSGTCSRKKPRFKRGPCRKEQFIEVGKKTFLRNYTYSKNPQKPKLTGLSGNDGEKTGL